MYVCGCNDNFQDDGQGGCEVVPGTCGNESFFGRCTGDTLTYCDLGGGDPTITVVDCKADGLVCGKFNSVVGYDCLNPKGVAAGGKCAADSYQVCDDTVPFCVSEEGKPRLLLARVRPKRSARRARPRRTRSTAARRCRTARARP